MGGKSKSSTSQSQETTNTQNIETTTVGLEDVESSNVALGNQTINQTTTDFGAVRSSLDFADDAFESAADLGEKALSVTERGLTGAQDLAEFSIDRSLDFGGEALEEAFAFGKAQSNASNAVALNASGTLSKAIDQAAAATRSDSSQSLEKIVTVLAVAGGAVLVAFALFRRRG